MTRQARSSAVIMGFDTHMILETVPVPPSNARTCTRTSTGHHATMPRPWGEAPRQFPPPTTTMLRRQASRSPASNGSPSMWRVRRRSRPGSGQTCCCCSNHRTIPMSKPRRQDDHKVPRAPEQPLPGALCSLGLLCVIPCAGHGLTAAFPDRLNSGVVKLARAVDR
jgi:hypothetical protein